MGNSTELERQKAVADAHVKTVFENQVRLRQNIQSLEKVSQSKLVDRYCKDLNNEEDDLIKKRKQIDELSEKHNSLRAKLSNLKLEAKSEIEKMQKALNEWQ